MKIAITKNNVMKASEKKRYWLSVKIPKKSKYPDTKENPSTFFELVNKPQCSICSCFIEFGDFLCSNCSVEQTLEKIHQMRVIEK